MVDAMTAIHKAIFTDKAMPGPGVTADFFAGDAGDDDHPDQPGARCSRTKFGWDLVPLPAGPSGEYAVIGQAGIGVLKKGKNADAAEDFLAYFTNPANSAKLGPVLPAAAQVAAHRGDPGEDQPAAEARPAAERRDRRDQRGDVKPSHTGHAELQQTVRAALDPLWKADADVKAVLAGVCSEINPMLGK